MSQLDVQVVLIRYALTLRSTTYRSHWSSIQTVCALENFFLSMSLYPAAQRKAQDEIDAVIGNDRLPEFSDMDSLPYVKALTEEVWR